MIIIDTDVIIDIQRGYEPAITWFGGLSKLPLIPGFVVMELIQDAANLKQVRDVLALVEPFELIWPTQQECIEALSFFTRYHLSNKLGLIDSLIGAMSVSRSANLITFNIKHYRIIPSINLIQPYQK